MREISRQKTREISKGVADGIKSRFAAEAGDTDIGAADSSWLPHLNDDMKL